MNSFNVQTENIAAKIKKIIKRYKMINYVFVFGSSLKNLLSESDIDILIGGELSFIEKTDISVALESIFRRKIDVVLVKESCPEIIMKALSEGAPVIINSRSRLKDDYFNNFRLYEDRENLRKLRISRIKRRYRRGG